MRLYLSKVMGAKVTYFTIRPKYLKSTFFKIIFFKGLQTINAGEDVEKREPSYTVGGNAN